MRAVAMKYAKCVGGWGCTLDPAGGAHDASPDPLVGWEGGHPTPHLSSNPLGALILTPAVLV